jgi:Tol biopolymer transport system component
MNVWVANADGTEAVKVADATRGDWASWSPDGRWISYTSEDEAGAMQIFLVPAGGGRPRNITGDLSGQAFFSDWSPS